VWLTTEEAETHPVVKEKFLTATSSDTLRSRSKTGKHARQLRSAWTDEWNDPANPDPLGMPLQPVLVGEAERRIARTAASNDGSRQLINYFVGQAVGMMNESKPTTKVVFDLVDQYVDAATRVAATIADD
jgi:NAD(P)H-dependent flavin oxidoreductase YrpB (nitropropane dioxygenase family)